MSTRAQSGFTLIEVLIALAITAFVSVIAYSSISTVIVSVETLRDNGDRVFEVNRAWMIMSRDLRQLAARPIRDEFGEQEPALSGGSAAPFDLSFSRTGWHNPLGHRRSSLQRVNYRIEDEALWRDTYYVLDRSGDSEPESVLLLSDVESMELRFLPSVDTLEFEGRGTDVDTGNWLDDWVLDRSNPNATLPPPQALEVRLQLLDWGELRRVYALPPL